MSASCCSPRSTRAGYDLVTANNVKVLVNLVVTLFALPVFIVQGDVVWVPALVLAAGFMAGGWFGAKLAVRGGEQLVRIFMVVAALFLAGRLLGLWADVRATVPSRTVTCRKHAVHGVVLWSDQ